MDGSWMGGSEFFPPHLSPASFSLHVPSLFYFRFRSGAHATEHASLIAIISHKEPWWFVVCGLLSHRAPHAAHPVMLRTAMARTGIPLERPLVGPPIFQQRDPPAPCSKTHKTSLDPCNRGLI